MDWLQVQREMDNHQNLFNIQELLKIIADQQQQIIKLLAKQQGVETTNTTTKKK